MLWMDGQQTLRAWLDDEHAAMMVASRELHILRRPAYDERVTVRTWMYQLRGPMGYRNTCIYDAQGKVTSACWAIGVFVGLDSGHVLKIPESVAQSMGLEPKLEDIPYGKRKIALPKVEAETLDAIRARRSDIDFNGHVNNAQYVRMAYDLLPRDISPVHMRIMHEGQAKLGETVVPMLYQEGARWVFTLDGEDGRNSAIVEFE